MKKLFTILLIMMTIFSLVLVSCSNNPNEEKKEEAEETPKEEEINETELQVLGKKYSALSSNIKSLVLASDHDIATYNEKRNLTVKSSTKDSFSIMTEDEKTKYNNGKGSNASRDVSEKSNTITTITEYASFELESSYKNEKSGDEDYSLKRESLTLKITPKNGKETSYSDDGGNELDPIYGSSLMEEYEALLDIYKASDNSLTFKAGSEEMKKVLQLIKEYAPELNITVDFGNSDTNKGELKADVVVSTDSDEKIVLSIKKASLSVAGKTLFSTENAVIKVTLGEDFTLKCSVAARTDSGDTSLYIDFTSIKTEGGVTFDFEGVTVKSPYDEKHQFEMVTKGSISYNFTSKDAKADVEICDKAKIQISGIESILPAGTKLPDLGITVGFSYEGKISLTSKKVEDSGEEDEGLELFKTQIKNFKITKFMIGNLPITTDSVNTLIQSSSEKIYKFLVELLSGPDQEESGESEE